MQGRIIKAGQEVLVVANCKGFRFAGSTVESPVLDSDDLKVQQNFPEGPFFAMAKVRENTKPGTYPISFICGGTKLSGHFVVVGDQQAPVVEKPGKHVKKPGKQVAKVPVGAPQTGSGGTAELAGMAKSEPVSVDIPRIGAQSTH